MDTDGYARDIDEAAVGDEMLKMPEGRAKLGELVELAAGALPAFVLLKVVRPRLHAGQASIPNSTTFIGRRSAWCSMRGQPPRCACRNSSRTAASTTRPSSDPGCAATPGWVSNTAVAVRSSATGEDGGRRVVRGDDGMITRTVVMTRLIDAVRRCWASSFSSG